MALDSLGLLLFFIPGVVAFAVDFSTGAIYLPMEPSYPGYGANPQQLPNTAPQSQPWPSPQPADAASATPKHCQPTWQECGLKRVAIPREELQRQRIEQVVTHHVGQPVSLDNRQARLSVLPCIERFDEQAGRHRSNHNFGVAVRSFFARLKLA